MGCSWVAHVAQLLFSETQREMSHVFKMGYKENFTWFFYWHTKKSYVACHQKKNDLLSSMKYTKWRIWEENECQDIFSSLSSVSVCPRSSDPFYIVSYYIESVTTSWTYSILDSYYCPVLRLPIQLICLHTKF